MNNTEPEKHSRLSPSSAHRWSRCTASVEFCEALGQDPQTSDAAEYGREAHKFAAMWLTTGKKPEIPDQEMEKIVAEYVEYLMPIRDTALVYGVERYVDLSWVLTPDTGGTCDFFAVDANLSLHLADLKTGYVEVSADSEQLMLYAAGLLGEFPSCQNVVLYIIQPRSNNYDTCVKTRKEVLAVAAKLRNVAWEINRGETTYSPDVKQCRWCPGLTSVGDKLHADYETAQTSQIDEGIAERLANLELYEMYLKALRSYAYQALLHGYKVDGWKLVAGRKGARKWTNENEVEAKLKTLGLKEAEIYERSVKTPTKIEKIVGKQKMADLSVFVENKPGLPAMVRESDKREALQTKNEDLFEDLTERKSHEYRKNDTEKRTAVVPPFVSPLPNGGV